MDEQDKRLLRAIYDRLGDSLSVQKDAAASLRFFKGLVVCALLLSLVTLILELLASLGILVFR